MFGRVAHRGRVTRSILALGVLVCSSVAAVPVWSQVGPTDDGGRVPEAPDSFGIREYDDESLERLRLAAQVPADLDPWHNGMSAVELWKLATAENVRAQRHEYARLDLERAAASARVTVGNEIVVAVANRDRDIAVRLESLIVEQFMHGEERALDRLTGENDSLYVEVPIEVATENYVELKGRSATLLSARRSDLHTRRALESQARGRVDDQLGVVREAETLDRTARRFGLDQSLELRRRVDQTLEASGEAPPTVNVGGFVVSPQIAGQLGDLLAAAAEAEISFGGWGYRSTDEQIGLRISHCGQSGYDIFDGPSPACSPPTARPLHSQHELGLAIDFTEDGAVLTSASPGFIWLQENAATYGFYNLPSEPWHWSTTGH